MDQPPAAPNAGGLLAIITTIPGIGPALPWIMLVVTIASIATMAMPPPNSTTGFYSWAYHFLNYARLAFFNAKNVAAPGQPSTSVTVAATRHDPPAA